MLRTAGVLTAASIGLLVASLAALFLLTNSTPFAGDRPKPLVVYCAVSVRPAVEAMLARYEAEQGVRSVLQLGPSGGLETQIRLTGRGDLYLPAAVTPFLDRLQEAGLIDEVLPVARMRLVLAAEPEVDSAIVSIEQLIESGEPFGLCNVQAAAGERARRAMTEIDLWDRINEAATASFPTVTELAEAVRSGGRLRYGIVWDLTAEQFGLRVIDVPELAKATAEIGVGVLRSTRQPEAARRLARYLASTDRGQPAFTERPYQTVPSEPWSD